MLGAILCGGAGSRLGQPKATALLGGRPLAAWVIEALEAAGCTAVLVTRREVPVPDLGVETVFDEHPTRHPLSGILAALDHARGPVLAVATDLPFLDPALLRRLAGRDGAVVVPRTPDGRLHPLCARYAPAVRPALAAALERQAPLQATVSALDPVLVAAGQRALTNINRPEDLKRAEGSLPPTPRPPSSRSAPRP